MSEIDGIVSLGDKKRGKRVLNVMSPTGIEKEHLIPQGKHLLVHAGDRVRSGEALTEGPLVPHDILRISGEEAVQGYLLREVQAVYRSQNVTIDDKHIEIIVSQMMRKVRIEDPGDTEFLPGSVVDKFRFRRANRDVIEANGRPARATPLLLGITKASLQSDSFISAASFQETTRVLTEAAVRGLRDDLRGLKENVIVGRLIPAGTGFAHHAERRRTREQDLADQLRELEELQAAAAVVSGDAAADEADEAGVDAAEGVSSAEASVDAETLAEAVVAANESEAAPEGGEETTTA